MGTSCVPHQPPLHLQLSSCTLPEPDPRHWTSEGAQTAVTDFIDTRALHLSGGRLNATVFSDHPCIWLLELDSSHVVKMAVKQYCLSCGKRLLEKVASARASSSCCSRLQHLRNGHTDTPHRHLEAGADPSHETRHKALHDIHAHQHNDLVPYVAHIH